jgi:hypothetical protein
MKKIIQLSFFIFLAIQVSAQQSPLVITKQQLKDKIMGGWAGQTIGVTFGGPMEFKYSGTIINTYQPVPWYDGYIKNTMVNNPGLYDDLYVDLTFVNVFEKEGLDAPAASFANALAKADYPLWHANQAARYNVLHGILPPASGQWKNNPHADCIDYQIECDYAGLMCPGMPNTAAAISDKIGHIMNYGDGWYGGVFLGACYTLAFTSNDVKFIVNEALKTIPKESNYYKCIADVIQWHKINPVDWKRTWYNIQEKWAQDIGCPEGVFAPFNIDATVNSAYVVMGLLYGNGDFTKTLEITTRCGQDADCNPSSVGGILGTMLGYSNIPAYWKMGLKEAEDINFKYTNISLNSVYEMGTTHALLNIKKNGGKINGDKITIAVQKAQPVKMEKSFDGMYPVDKKFVYKTLEDEYSFDFDGTGFAIRGVATNLVQGTNYIFGVELYLDGKKIEQAQLPTRFEERRYELFWKYQLTRGKHTVKLKLLNPDKNNNCTIQEILIYSDKANAVSNQMMHRFAESK